MNDCGGCRGLGSHRRWCEASVGWDAARLGTWSEQAEALGDMVGPNCMVASGALWRAAGLLYDAAMTALTVDDVTFEEQIEACPLCALSSNILCHEHRAKARGINAEQDEDARREAGDN